MMAKLDAFTERCNFPYLHGIYLAVNALSDAYLVVDGPNCAFFKAEHIFGSHDWASTLLDVLGRHRVINTDIGPDKVIAGHEDTLVATLRSVCESGLAGVVLAGALPMASITGVDYEGLVERAAAGTDVATCALPARSLDRDWLDGYADFLLRLAQTVVLPARQTDPRRIALVGYLMDRNEGDHRANLTELRRLVDALDLELAPIWLSGGNYAELSEVAGAGHVVSLPHGRAAGRELADRLGAELIEAELPFGPAATGRFLRTIGAATGRLARAEEAIDADMRQLARAWEWMIPKRLQFRRLRFVGDPYFVPGLAELCTSLGMELVELIAYGAERSEVSRATASLPTPIRWQPRLGATPPGTQEHAEVDLTISNFWGLHRGGYGSGPTPLKTLEFGFPSRAFHCTFDEPFLGYKGAAAFVDRISNALGDRGQFL